MKKTVSEWKTDWIKLIADKPLQKKKKLLNKKYSNKKYAKRVTVHNGAFI